MDWVELILIIMAAHLPSIPSGYLTPLNEGIGQCEQEDGVYLRLILCGCDVNAVEVGFAETAPAGTTNQKAASSSLAGRTLNFFLSNRL
jgi:hypothetical protein